jgi:hypothetical protein
MLFKRRLAKNKPKVLRLIEINYSKHCFKHEIPNIRYLHADLLRLTLSTGNYQCSSLLKTKFQNYVFQKKTTSLFQAKIISEYYKNPLPCPGI